MAFFVFFGTAVKTVGDSKIQLADFPLHSNPTIFVITFVRIVELTKGKICKPESNPQFSP